MRHFSHITIGLTIFAGATAFAQTPSRFAWALGYPPTVAVVWHTSERFALRPDLSLSHVRFDGGSSSSSSSRSLALGAGLTGLVYLSKSDSLRAYLAPRFSYARTSTAGGTILEGLGGSFLVGTQYSLHRRLAVFAELGPEYVNAKRWQFFQGQRLPSATQHTWSIRSSVGLLLYLR